MNKNVLLIGGGLVVAFLLYRNFTKKTAPTKPAGEPATEGGEGAEKANVTNVTIQNTGQPNAAAAPTAPSAATPAAPLTEEKKMQAIQGVRKKLQDKIAARRAQSSGKKADVNASFLDFDANDDVLANIM